MQSVILNIEDIHEYNTRHTLHFEMAPHHLRKEGLVQKSYVPQPSVSATKKARAASPQFITLAPRKPDITVNNNTSVYFALYNIITFFIFKYY